MLGTTAPYNYFAPASQMQPMMVALPLFDVEYLTSCLSHAYDLHKAGELE